MKKMIYWLLMTNTILSYTEMVSLLAYLISKPEEYEVLQNSYSNMEGDENVKFLSVIVYLLRQAIPPNNIMPFYNSIKKHIKKTRGKNK